MVKSTGTVHEPINRDLLVAESAEQGAFFDLVRTASRLEGELNRLLRPYELTTATYSILSVLERVAAEGLSCGDIAAQLIAEVPDMTRLLDRLEKLEYVVRERSMLDRRMVKVKITERGLQVVRGLKGPVRECHRVQFTGVDPNEIHNLRELLRLVIKEEGGRSAVVVDSPETPKPQVSASGG